MDRSGRRPLCEDLHRVRRRRGHAGGCAVDARGRERQVPGESRGRYPGAPRVARVPSGRRPAVWLHQDRQFRAGLPGIARRAEAQLCGVRAGPCGEHMITAAGQFTADDYVAANKLHMQQRGWKRVAWIVFWVVLGVGALLSADVAVQDPDAGLTPLLLIFLVVALQLFVRIVYVP